LTIIHDARTHEHKKPEKEYRFLTNNDGLGKVPEVERQGKEER